MTSVSVSSDGSLLAVALQAEGYDENGRIALFSIAKDGSITLRSIYEAGVQPDMVVFGGYLILSANEGEPREGYDAADPKGSITVVDLSSSSVENLYFDDFDGKTIAMSSGGTEKDSIEEITDANITFVEYTDFSEAKMALTAGTVDGFAADSSILTSYLDDSCEFIDTKFSPQPYGIATKKGSDLCEYVNDLIAQWSEDGTLDQLVTDNDIQPSYVDEEAE